MPKTDIEFPTVKTRPVANVAALIGVVKQHIGRGTSLMP